MRRTLQEYETWVEDRRKDQYYDKVTYDVIALAGEAGEILSTWKKQARGDLSDVDFVEDVLLESGDVLHYLIRLLHNIGYTLEDAAKANQEKLTNREKYGKGKHGKRS